MSTVTAVNEENFDTEVLASPVPVVVDFWADWCRPCHAIAPILEQIAEEHPDTLKIVKLNIDENPSRAEEYEVSSIPTLKVFVDGAVDATLIGAKPRRDLERELAAYLS